MKLMALTVGLLLALSPLVIAQDASTANSQDDKPSGTKVVGHDQDTIVKPTSKSVKVDHNTVEAAQKALTDRGYQPGAADGVSGPQTRAAVSKFQGDQGLPQTGKLDVNTLTKLNVGGPETLSAAPGDVGRGGKAFGHNVKEGHPVEAGKALGEGTANAAKKVGKGTESVAKEGAEKAGEGMSAAGNKITGKAQGDTNKNQSQKPDDQNNPQ